MGDPISGGLGALGSLIGYFAGSGDRQKAQDALAQATQNYNGLDPRVQAALVGRSELGGVQLDPTMRNAQLEALRGLQNVYRNGGLDPQARAEMASQQQAANSNAQALNNQVRNSMAARGMSSSGANFAAQRSNAQNAANTAHLAGLQAMGQGQMRAQSALQGVADNAAGLRSQDYGQAANAAQANDAISRFNAANTMNAQQQSYGNALNKAQGQQGALGGQAGAWNDQAKKMQEMGQGIGQGVGAAGTAVATGGMSSFGGWP